MEKDFEFVELFEIYKGLLTEKQRDLFFSHYFLDLSLAEIAEQEGGTRQNVYDSIKKVKTKLVEYEGVLKLREKFSKVKDIANKIKNESLQEELIDIIGK